MRKFRYLIIAAVFVLDHVVKWAVRATMFCGETIPVINNVLSLTYVQNRGAAFSLFTGRGLLLTIVPLLALCVALIYMEIHKDRHWTLLLALELIIAGGAGNLIDRIALGYVTDMFDLHFWPVFNVADIAICVGCGFLILYIFLFDKPESEECVKKQES